VYIQYKLIVHVIIAVTLPA